MTATRTGSNERRRIDRREFLGAAGVATAIAASPGLLGCVSDGEAPAPEPAPSKLLIRNGLVVTHEGRELVDIEVRDGVVHAVGAGLPQRDDLQSIDASGRWVLPGGVDPHTHLHFPYAESVAESFADDYPTGTLAALAGGITTVGAITFRRLGEGMTDAVRREARVAERESRCDVFLHPTVGVPTFRQYVMQRFGWEWQATFDQEISELQSLSDGGQPSLKVFLSVPEIHGARERLPALLEAAKSHSVVSLFHCEDAGVIEQATARLRAEGRDSLRYYAESRPVEAEVASVRAAVELSERTGAPIYIVHLSSSRALDICAAARHRGVRVYVETRPMYLHLTADRFAEADGQKYICQPPLRSAEDVDAMWAGLADGALDCLASDHAPWTLEQKLDPALTFEHNRAGISNLRVMLPMAFSEGVLGKRITPERFVAVTSTNAAKIFGLYPQKGTIAPGSDADLVVWNPDVTRMIERDQVLSRSGYSVYEGTEVTGWPELVIARGRIAYEKGTIEAQPGFGHVVPRGAAVHEPFGPDRAARA